uniref:peptidylprolyl isomerase n=1 Tax=Microbulbifer agarilyticus TaxID=260552 RepID=UPI0002558690|nr:peptidylprolyl isomerase [Microbulbifer agarilyticus]
MSSDNKDNAVQYVEIPPVAIPTVDVTDAHPEPQMPSACETGGCGCATGSSEPLPTFSFGEVKVNGVSISEDVISREMQHHRAESAEAAWQAAARALVIKTLLLQEAHARNIQAPSADENVQEADDRSETDEDARVRTLLEEVLTPEQVREEECRRYYDTQTHRFRTPDLFEAAHILIEPNEDSESAWQEAEQSARSLIDQLGDDPQAFSEAAEQFSGCPTAHQGGSLGQIRRGELEPALHDVLETLAEGTLCRAPVRSRFGWHLIRLHRKIQGRTLPFNMAREKIHDMLEARAWVNSASHYIAELAQGADIEGVEIDSAQDTDSNVSTEHG